MAGHARGPVRPDRNDPPATPDLAVTLHPRGFAALTHGAAPLWLTGSRRRARISLSQPDQARRRAWFRLGPPALAGGLLSFWGYDQGIRRLRRG